MGRIFFPKNRGGFRRIKNTPTSCEESSPGLMDVNLKQEIDRTVMDVGERVGSSLDVVG